MRLTHIAFEIIGIVNTIWGALLFWGNTKIEELNGKDHIIITNTNKVIKE